MRHHPDRRSIALTAVLGGLLLGILDFIWIKFVPFPFADLGNSSAVWAVAAFAFGFWVRTGWVRAAIGAAVALVVAVPGYYAAAALIQGDEWSILWAPTSLLWMSFGVLAGVVFGIGGVWAHERGWRQPVGIALPGAVLFAEALIDASRINHPNYGIDPLWDVLIKTALGVLVVVVVARGTRARLLALATALPLALIGFAAFRLAGFGA
ncbi:DUF6518 family protein [Micromonospora gifhornensis]|uniref:DUF6518 family protein n=1 Tax=Micromonospora gifhornensis TaxID=84594 RepID=UPI003453ADF1